MNEMNCQTIEASIRDGFSEWTSVTPLNSDECLVRLPFWDGAGDPIELSVTTDSGRALIDDAGSVAGLFFSLGQDDQATPAFKLLEDLQQTHGFEIDFDNGVITLSVAEENLFDGVAEMAKVVLAMNTVVPHIRVAPRRVGSFGPRLRSRISRRYRQLKILDMVQRSYPLAGATVSDWPVDFHWSVRRNGSSYEVNVVAADLTVSEPLVKAHKVASLSLDTREQHQHGKGRLRVVIESQDNHSESLVAAEFLRVHSNELDYRLFDLGRPDENSDFYSSSAEELLTSVPKQWAEIMPC